MMSGGRDKPRYLRPWQKIVQDFLGIDAAEKLQLTLPLMAELLKPEYGPMESVRFVTNTPGVGNVNIVTYTPINGCYLWRVQTNTGSGTHTAAPYPIDRFRQNPGLVATGFQTFFRTDHGVPLPGLWEAWGATLTTTITQHRIVQAGASTVDQSFRDLRPPIWCPPGYLLAIGHTLDNVAQHLSLVVSEPAYPPPPQAIAP